MQTAKTCPMGDKKYLVTAFLIACIGLYGIGMVFFHGQEESYGVSREVPLGLLLISYAFFVGISVGLSIISTLSHVSKLQLYSFKSIHIVLLSLTFLLGAFFLIFWELGGPFQLQVLRFIRYYVNFETGSPIWWMSTFYVLETPLLALEVFLLFKGSKKAVFWAGIVGFFLGLTAFSTLSMVFAVNDARPIWHTAQLTITFVLGALTCGAGVTLLFSRLRRKSLSEENVTTLSKMIFIYLIALGFIYIWNAVITKYSTGSSLAEQMKIFTSGPLSFNYYFFEIFLGILAPMALLVIGRFKSVFFGLSASLCAIIGAFFGRFDAVVGGQLTRVESAYVPNLPYASYTPSLAEISILISGFGVALFLYEIGNWFLKLEGGEDEKH